MGREPIGTMCYVMYLKATSTLVVKKRGSPQCFLVQLAADWASALCKPLHGVTQIKVSYLLFNKDIDS